METFIAKKHPAGISAGTGALSAHTEFMQAAYGGLPDKYARFIEEKQLKDEKLWKKFADVFKTNADVADGGWRGEYWGKMMRGACLTYLYTYSEGLYAVLESAVRSLLAAQDGFGRISCYDIAHEFSGWDVWGRKYVLVGLEYFYGICRDGQLRERILSAMCAQADYMTEKVGGGKGQIPVTQTSEWWGGVNSASVLEPFVQLYKLTGEEKYLRFAEYIISTGGCRDGNLIDLLVSGKQPYEFPETKAYETMSFFEGLIAYYEATGKEKYLSVAIKFADAVQKSDITVIGCAGCTHELFDHSEEMQTEYSDIIMQETCVTVTWMRFLARLWRLTADARYMDWIEQSARNALYGSINTQDCKMYSLEKKTELDPLPFDSYSPLYNNRRGRGVGGYKEFADGGYYGCCACIGAAGTALYPLYAAVRKGDGFYINFFMNGSAKGVAPSGRDVSFSFETDYPAGGLFSARIYLNVPETFTVFVRAPEWCETAAECCGERARACGGYIAFTREWHNGDRITAECDMRLRVQKKNGKAAYLYGALVLARDEQKECCDLTAPLIPILHGRTPVFERLPEAEGEQVRIQLSTAHGNVLLTDYASCGKNWTKENSRISVWFNT